MWVIFEAWICDIERLNRLSIMIDLTDGNSVDWRVMI